MSNREVTIPTPRCPMCDAMLTEAQIKMEKDPWNPFRLIPHEVWTCHSCHTTHVFPARRAFLEWIGKSKLLPTSQRVLELPHGVSK